MPTGATIAKTKQSADHPEDFVGALRDTVSSLTIGAPISALNLTVFPLLGADRPAVSYITFPEGRANKTTAITEVSEGGSVPELRVVNDGKDPVLLLDGEELIGAKQNRIVNLTILVPADATITIPVSCVEAGRWSSRSVDFQESSDAMFASARARKLDDVTASLRRGGRRATNQSAVWRDIADKSERIGTRSSTHAMQDAFSQHRRRVEDYVEAITPAEGQLGALFAIDGVVRGLELFDTADTCRKFLPKLVRSWALDAIESGDATNRLIETQTAHQAIAALLSANESRHPAIGLGTDLRLSANSVRGAALEVDDHIVHLTAFWGDSRESDAAPQVSLNRILLRRLVHSGRTDLQLGVWANHTPPALPTDNIDDRVEGMLLGLAIGDALGNTSESSRPDHRQQRHGIIRDYLPNSYAGGRRVGLPSDDSQLSFWTLEHLLEDGALDPVRLARRFASNRIVGIGQTVRAFLRSYKDEGRPWEESAQRSAGNGALMRIAPVLIPHVRRPSPDLWSDVAIAAMLTHNDPASIGACVGFVHALWGALGMRETPRAGYWVESVCEVMRQIEGDTRYASRSPHIDYDGPMSRFVYEQVHTALENDLPVAVACARWYSGAYLMETLPSVLYILERHASDPEEAMVRAVNDTWDNDTIASIVGAAVGALHGAQALPKRWVQNLLGRTGENDDGRVFELIAEAKRRWM